MTERKETLADIVAEMRAYDNTPPPKRAWLDLAGRIEEAWKAEQERQRAEWEARTLRELLVAKEENRAEFLKERGDPAAMRNALLNCKTRFSALAMQNAEWQTCAQNHIQEIDMALAAPPRNCDLYAGRNAAMRAYLHFAANAMLPDSEANDTVEWLFATATPEKGGTP